MSSMMLSFVSLYLWNLSFHHKGKYLSWDEILEIVDFLTLFCGKVENGMDYIVYCEVLEYDSIMLNITDIALHTDIIVT